jgi:O-antigen ligase
VKEIQQNSNIIPDSWLKYILFYAISIAFIFVNAYLVLKKDTLLAVLVPIAVLVFLTFIFSFDKLIWITILCAPLSIPLKKIAQGLPFDMHLPTEPILLGVVLFFMFSILTGKTLGKEITRHPIAIVIYFYLGWMAFTSMTSSLPLVSFKYLLTRIWFIIPFFFLLIFLFKNQKNIDKFIWLFTIAMVPVIFYTIIRHLGYGLYDKQAANFVMYPFFKDHTSYGAVLAMYIPFLLGFSFADWIEKKYRIWIWGLTGLFFVAEILSYTRAAWLSLMAVAGIWVLVRLKIKFKTIMIILVSLTLVIFAFEDQLLQRLERNSQDSSANLLDHFTSMTNISTDASNLERINRWQCAIELFKERPVLGWGPGTYQMHYAPYQLSKQRTIISTNSGDGGNAHSEYLGSLAESGVLGTLSFLAIIISVLTVGLQAYSKTDDKRLKTLLLAAVLGLVTYYAHGILNNFLDMDKASIPFWGFTAIIVSIDILIRQQKKPELQNNPGHYPEMK